MDFFLWNLIWVILGNFSILKGTPGFHCTCTLLLVNCKCFDLKEHSQGKACLHKSNWVHFHLAGKKKAAAEPSNLISTSHLRTGTENMDLWVMLTFPPRLPPRLLCHGKDKARAWLSFPAGWVTGRAAADLSPSQGAPVLTSAFPSVDFCEWGFSKTRVSDWNDGCTV